jgi:P pilus assembly chaperone PapD
MSLKPTDDVVFFPQLLTINPREDRKVRVGVTAPPAAAEKTYRLFVEELAPEQRPQHSSTPQVLVLTKMGIPIFLDPPLPSVSGSIDSMRMNHGRFLFAVKNTGNVHFSLNKVRVSGMLGDSTVFSRETTGSKHASSSCRLRRPIAPKSSALRLTLKPINPLTRQPSRFVRAHAGVPIKSPGGIVLPAFGEQPGIRHHFPAGAADLESEPGR